MTTESVRAWAEQVTIPTYAVGAPDKNPMFLEKRVYQGSSGVVYPYPVIDRVADEKADRSYTALFLENRYLKIMVLPEIGGRVQMALDKTNGYHFVYFNRVIKPALVGLAGPWISGGIEFNWPQHHRPTTFMPLDWRIVEEPDGARTVWCGEIEPMFNTKGIHGFRLHPDRALLEILVQLSNRTAEPQTFLWWANPAVHVNDAYQSVFPPDVHAVMDHGKRDVSPFPIATGTYYKVDYAPGTDISRYKNIPVPTSYMAYRSDYDFVGCYDHAAKAGMLHVANHHLVPGKKQWTWGNGEFGRAWDRHLTDEDGPYIELMCGAFTDNQPDFSWLMPGEEKRFTQVFMPYKRIGAPHNATRDAAIRLEVAGGVARFGVYLSAPRTVRVTLMHKEGLLYERTEALDPERVLLDEVALPAGARASDLTLAVLDGDTLLVSFTPPPDETAEMPAPATPARPPAEIASNEELFLNGQHLEQYRHATFAPEPYYEEALRRDPDDARCNNALGLLLYRRGRFAEAELFFRRAVRRLTLRNPNPYDGEPHYNLGLCLRMQGRDREAFDVLYKATWSSAWQDPAFFVLAQLAAKAGRRAEALELAQHALERNIRHHQARHLKTALLRQVGRHEEAMRETEAALALDPLEYGALWERHLLGADDSFQRYAQAVPGTTTAIALDYAHAGLYTEAEDLLRHAPHSDVLARIFAGWVRLLAGDEASARELFRAAADLPSEGCLPNRLEAIPALEAMMRLCPADARAPYYLGLFWYSHRCHSEAIACWEQARALDPHFPTVHRNLGLAYVNTHGNLERARESYQRAFALDPNDARVLFELDQLERRLNRPPEERLARLDQHPALVTQRDDLTVERIGLLNQLGRHAEALAVLLKRRFHPWEGGEGKVTGQYVAALVGLARIRLGISDGVGATTLLERAKLYPESLGEGKLVGAQENQIDYLLGCAYECQRKAEMARPCFERAAVGLSEPTTAVYYNDQPPDMIFYQGLARRKLGREEEAHAVFQRLVAYGREHLDDAVTIDYFAVSLPDFLVFNEDLQQRNRVHCHYIAGLGHLGLGEREAAITHFDAALSEDSSHLGAATHRALALVA